MSSFEDSVKDVLNGPPKGLEARVREMSKDVQSGTFVRQDRVPFGKTKLPARFLVDIQPHPWPDDPEDRWSLILVCEVVPGRDTSEVVQAVAVGRDLVWTLDHVKKKWPISKIKLWAHASLILGLIAGRYPVAVEYYARPTGGFLLDRAMSLLLTASPQKRRRTTVTDDHLSAVAAVYLGAPEKPTMAVASHFHASHSTAARWVGLARKAGLIPPVTE